VGCNKLTALRWSKPLESRETTGAERVISVAVDERRNSLLFWEWTPGGYIGGRVVFENPMRESEQAGCFGSTRASNMFQSSL
jgi:hypothetical protein